MLTLLYPSSLPAASVRDYLQTFLSDRRRFHSRRLLILLALLPPTAALCILPGPNPLLALWAFRAMGHWQARDGAKQLQLRPTIDYMLNSQLNLQLYYSQTITTPRAGNAFRNATTEGGIQLRYSFTQ